MDLKKRNIFRTALAIPALVLLMTGKGRAKESQEKKREETAASLEEQVKHLTEKLEQQSRRLQRMEDVNEIQNLMSKERYLFEAGRYEERWDLVAKKTPGVTVEIGARGVFKGAQGARKTMVDYQNNVVRLHAAEMRRVFPDTQFPSDIAGMVDSSLLGSSVIEVAGDGKTAKGVWVALMVAAATTTNDGPPKGHWVWWKIGADLVKEDGHWKLWHFQMNPMFGAFSSPNWAEEYLKTPDLKKMREKMHQNGEEPWSIPDAPTTQLYNPYGKTTVPTYYPTPPDPYQGFAEKK